MDGRQAADLVDRAVALGVALTVFQNRRLDAANPDPAVAPTATRPA